jgi:replicative DNA helicase
VESTYDFGETFQTKLLSLTYAGLIAPPTINPSYFTNPILSEICDSILTLRQEYADITHEMLRTHLFRKRTFKDKEYKEELLGIFPSIFKAVKPQERAYLFDLAFKFAKLQQYRDFFRQGVDILQDQNTESLEQLDQLFAETSMITKTNDEIGDFYFSSLTSRLRTRNQHPEVLSTLIPALDKCLANGGISKGELLVFAGLASQGKSFALLHMAQVALLQMKKVVFYSLEMEAEKVATRLDAAFSGLFTHSIKDHGDIVEARISSLMKQFGDNLLIKRMAAGHTRISDIQAHLDTLKFKSFVPEVLILDYINLMRPESNTREGRHRDLGEVYIGLKGLGQQRNMYPITAAQSNRTGFNAPLITIQHFADTFEGGMHADIIVTLNRDDDEAQQEKIRLYVAKDRDGVDKRIIHGYTNYSKGAFWSRKHAQHTA